MPNVSKWNFSKFDAYQPTNTQVWLIRCAESVSEWVTALPFTTISRRAQMFMKRAYWHKYMHTAAHNTFDTPSCFFLIVKLRLAAHVLSRFVICAASESGVLYVFFGIVILLYSNADAMCLLYKYMEILLLFFVVVGGSTVSVATIWAFNSECCQARTIRQMIDALLLYSVWKLPYHLMKYPQHHHMDSLIHQHHLCFEFQRIE